MKKKIFLSFSVLLFALVLTSLFGGTAGFAMASESLTLKEVKALDDGGDLVAFDISKGEYGRGIKFYFDCPEYAYSYKIYVKSSGVYTKIHEVYMKTVENNEFCIEVSKSGVLKLEVSAMNETAMVVSTKEYEFKSDNVAPFEPLVDDEELSAYHVSEFNLSYKLQVDNDSGIDFDKCSYKITDLEGGVLVPAVAIQAGSVPYGDKVIPSIGSVCRIEFTLYDKVGNFAVYSFEVTHYGIPISGIPTITAFPDGDYVSEAEITIDWGEEYNNNPYAKKFYAIAGGKTPVKTKYEGPFKLSEEGAEVIAYYYDEENKEKTVSKKISNIDRTNPSASLMGERFSVTIDLTASEGIYVKTYAIDMGSGIAKVYDNYGNIYTDLGEDYYGATIVGYHTFNVIAEDKVGNKASYGYSNPTLDFAMMKEYHEKFTSLVKSAYSEDGWNAILSAFNSLSLYILSTDANSNGILQKKTAVDEAINVDVKVATRLTFVPTGLSEFTLLSGAKNTDVKRGDTIRMVVGKILKTDEEINQIVANALNMAGYSSESYKAYNFTVDLTKDDGSAVKNNGSVVFSFATGELFGKAKLYLVNGNGSLEEVSIETSDNTIKAYALKTGSFVLVTQGVTKSEGMPLWKYIVIAVAIIIAVAGIVFAIVYFATGKNKNTTRSYYDNGQYW